MELSEILKLEASNRHHIYLYPYQCGAWGCCGPSAELLHHLLPNIPHRERMIPPRNIVLPVMIIDPMSLKSFLGKYPPKEHTSEQIVIEIAKEQLKDIW